MNITTWLAAAIILLLLIIFGLLILLRKRKKMYEKRLGEIEREAVMSLDRVEYNLKGNKE
ncbi:LPXTG cell wall anchor domain-containing protein [Bacillus sp. Marseille-Q1617]|uniref:LPXTG cell wall anchor domain-containing protein n=1 Tax=Bacillus sp. Marseille-Q1617 TaxID=2736887 RepID=UPI00158A4464|nr:LPXTG cell wall anchor domain-containing protein [Bacillus sp. Marseille-Q1617]